ncbi:MAG: MG2 domain-containing protein, partial [Anaerolineales bacterium]
RPSITAALIFIAAIIGVGVSIGIVAQTTDRGPDTGIIVVRFQPTGQTDRETNITVQFSNDMVSKDSLELVLTDVPLEFNPPVPGLARWIETDILRFYPDAPLMPATRYQVTVLASGTYVHGNRIREEQTFNFETKPIAVTDKSWRTEPAPGLPGRTRLYIDLTFNYQVNIDQLPELLSIKGAGDNAPKELSFEVDSYWGMRTDNLGVRYAKGVTVLTEPFEVSDKTQTFTLRIAKGLTCDYCQLPLPAPYEAPITIQGRQPLTISQVRPGIQNKQGVITAYFSARILDENLEKYVHVSPVKQISIESRYNRVLIRGEFIPGETYTVTIDPDLISQEGSKLGREFSTKVTIPDIPPSVEFTTPGIYLPENGSGLLETSTINVDSMSVEIDQIFANNLVYALGGGYDRPGPYSPQISHVGRRFFSKTIGVSGNLNEAHNTTIDVAGIIGDSARGIFRVAARNKNGRWSYDSRVVMITDIGIMARMSDNYLMVWANTLSELKPISKAVVKLYSMNNQELLSGETDSRGIAVFSDVSEKLKDFDPFAITVSTGDDLSYLRFDQTLLEMSTFDVSGRPYLESGYEAFVYSDRGVYRPGDTVHFAAVVRGRNAAVPPEFPYTLTIRDPSGRKFESYRLNTGSTGFQEQNFAVPDFARTGKYSAVAHIGKDYVIGRLEFQVEEFVPDKIKVTVSTARDEYSAGDTVDIDVNAVYLFGPPAANLNVSGHVTIEQHDFAPRKWSDYTFTDPNRKFSRTDIDLRDHQLNDSGQYRYPYVLPDNLKPPSNLTVLLAADVSEPGGRAVSGYRSILLNPYPAYVGMKFDFEGYAKPGERIGAELIALSPDAQSTPVDSVKVRFYRVVYHTVLQQDTRGRYRYVSERMPKLMDSMTTSIADTGSTVYFTPPQYGSYEVVAEDLQGGHRSSRSFYATGWGYAPWAMAQPDRIEIDLDKTSYEAGEQAAVQVRSPFGGKLLVTIEKESVLEFITFDMDSNTAEFTIPIKKDYAPNAYVTATVIRRAEDVTRTSPARAFGIAPIKLSNSDRVIAVTIDAPEVTRPETELSV